MIRSRYTFQVALLGLLLSMLLITSQAPASNASSSTLRKTCPGNTGHVAGTDGIYTLKAKAVSCNRAHKIVHKYHARESESGNTKQRAYGFKCEGHLTGGYEGLIVKCKRGHRRVSWTAYISY